MTVRTCPKHPGEPDSWPSGCIECALARIIEGARLRWERRAQGLPDE